VTFNAGFPAAKATPGFPNPQVSVELVNNPGDNVLNGGGGNDLLEGRGGADTLNGGDGLDFASYETSPGAVTVRLPGVGADTQTQIASGADAGWWPCRCPLLLNHQPSLAVANASAAHPPHARGRLASHTGGPNCF